MLRLSTLLLVLVSSCHALSSDGLRLSGRSLVQGLPGPSQQGSSGKLNALRGGFFKPKPPPPPPVQKSNALVQLWKRYEELLDKEPLKTRMISGFLIGFIGDVICQIATKESDSFTFDLKRLLVFATWGGIGFTPIAAQWYSAIERVVPQDMPVRWLFKVALDQSIFSVGMTAMTFVCLTIVEGWLSGFNLFLGKMPEASGKSIPAFPQLVEQGIEKVKDHLYPTLIENWKVWPIVQILNFSVVPLKFQTLFVNCVAIWWNFVLSLMQHK